MKSTQITWAFSEHARRFRPRYITLWGRPAGWENPTYELGILMSSDGRVVVDFKGNPIRDFRNLPLTISSKIEGLRMEEWLRADNRMLMDDIMARMWTKCASGGEMIPMYPRTTLTKRTSNARIRSGLVSFHRRTNLEEQYALMFNLRTPAQRAQNLATDRNLTEEQVNDWLLIGHKHSRRSSASSHQANANTVRNEVVAPTPTPIAQVQGQDVAMTNDVTTGGNSLRGVTWMDFPVASNTGNLSIAYQDPLDSRNERPKDVLEQATLQEALIDTVDQFLAMTGRLPNPASYNPCSSYFSQWYLLQAEFELYWAMSGSLHPPRLFLRGRWTGGISRWYAYGAGKVEDVGHDERYGGSTMF